MMMLLFLLIASLSLLLFLPKLIKNAKHNHPPGPKGLPLIGNIHQFDISAPHIYFSNLAKIYGPVLYLKFGCKPTVVIQSASLAKEVLKTQDNNFCTRPALFGLRKLSYDGSDISFAPYGEYYREIRKLCGLHLFNVKKVQSFSPIRREEVSRMIRKISDLSSASEIVNLSDLVMTLSASVICRLAFGKRPALFGLRKLSYDGSDISFAPYGEYYREIRKLCGLHLFNVKKVQSFSPIRREEVSRMIRKISDLSSASEIVNLSDLVMTLSASVICRLAFGKRYNEKNRFQELLNQAQAMFTTFFFVDYVPYVGRFLDKLTGLSSKLQKTFNNLDQFYDQIINDHLDPNRPKNDGEDIVDVLLNLRKERSFSIDVTLDHIKALFMNIISAGTDTSAAMVVWAMTELIKNPTTMKKVQHELRNSIKGKNFIEDGDIPNLKYLKAIIKETFRLHPAAPLLLVREAREKCTIQGYNILPGTLIQINVWAIARDPECWKDPELFMPERFMESSIDFRGQDFELIPFGGGRRMCPGMLLGVANFETMLANLLYSFDWEIPVGLEDEVVDVNVIPGITMHKSIPLRLVATKSSHILP